MERSLMQWASLLGIIFFTPYWSCYSVASQPCVPKDFGKGSFVCVCNASYCDTLQLPSPKPKENRFYLIQSSKDGLRFNFQEAPLLMSNSKSKESKHSANSFRSKKKDKSNDPLKSTRNSVDSLYSGLDKALVSPSSSPADILIDRSKTFQSILGFGGAFTDATGINIVSLSPGLQDIVIRQYFSEEGIQYNIARVPIGGSDFSTRPYTYDDEKDDDTLDKFKLAEEDIKYKIPFIKKALELQPSCRLFASPWSAPGWMKNNNDVKGFGWLLPKYYQQWADYFIKFLNAYAEREISFWGLTVQNEPIDGFIPAFPFNSMGFTPWQMRDFVKKNLGPTLGRHGYGNISLMVLDDQRYTLPFYAKIILDDPEAAAYVSGIALHWYGNNAMTPIEILDWAHKKYPSKFIFGSEACNGADIIFDINNHVSLGDWQRGVAYASDIIQNFNHFMEGWTDWNMVLDLKGGPNWVNNFVDAPIIADKKLDNIYKQPMYYALGHFSKFIPRDSIRIGQTLKGDRAGLEVLVCLRPDNATVVVMLNRHSKGRRVNIVEHQATILSVDVHPDSLTTIVY